MLKGISKILLCILLLFLVCACTNDTNSVQNDINTPNKKEDNENIDASNKIEDITTKLINEAPTGYKLYIHNVSMLSTNANSIFPNNYISIYSDTGLIEVNNKTTSYIGYIMTNIKVLAVLDENNEIVFKNENEVKTPSKMLFYVSDRDYSILQKAEKITRIQLLPYSKTNIINEELVNYILNN